MAQIKTTPLGLSQWEIDDKPRMEHFNRDNAIIDAELAKKADIKLEQALALPMDNGLQGNNVYSKDPFGRVHVYLHASISGTADDIISGTRLATLPVGFRPTSYLSFSAVVMSGSNGAYKHPANISISTDGGIIIYFDPSVSRVRYISADASFIAQGQ